MFVSLWWVGFGVFVALLSQTLLNGCAAIIACRDLKNRLDS